MAKKRNHIDISSYDIDELLGYDSLDEETSSDENPLDSIAIRDVVPEDNEASQIAEREVRKDIKVILNEMPDDMVKNMPTLNNRLSAYLSYYAAANLNRLPILTNFVRQAEETLYDPSRIALMSNEELMATYKSAKTAMGEILETTRKVSTLAESSKQTETDEVYELLKSLSPETLASLKDMLNDDSE